MRYNDARWQRLEDVLELSRIEMTAKAVVAWTLAAMTAVVVVLALVAPILALAGLLVPFGTRSLIRRRLKKIRDAFADELPANLQILASALRSGHSFSGALSVVVENAHEPARSELFGNGRGNYRAGWLCNYRRLRRWLWCRSGRLCRCRRRFW
jgi:Flp pilus assembly protein TadB